MRGAAAHAVDVIECAARVERFGVPGPLRGHPVREGGDSDAIALLGEPVRGEERGYVVLVRDAHMPVVPALLPARHLHTWQPQ